MRTPLLVLAVLLALLPASARAATVVVTSTADPGNGSCATEGCTLREAIALTENAGPGQDRIELRLPITSSTIRLASPLPTMRDAVAIVGVGRSRPTLDASGTPGGPGLHFDGADESFRVERLHVTGAPGSGVRLHAGRLEVADSAVTASGSTSTTGGGISASAPLVVRRSSVLHNMGWFGGGIHAAEGLVMEGSTVAGNSASEVTGGVLVEGASFITGSTVSGNTAPRSAGLRLVGAADVIDTTITANRLSASNASAAGLTLSGGRADLRNTVVAGNLPALDLEAAGPALVAHAFVGSWSGDVQRQPGVPSTLDGGDPRLGPLAANGGTTSTHLPDATSPLVDRGASARTTDQRGAPSPQDDPAIANVADGTDIGAVEVAAPPESPAPGDPVPPAAGGTGDPAPATPTPTPTPTPEAGPPAGEVASSAGSTPAPPVLRGFGRTPGVAVRLVDRRPSARGTLRVRLRNANAFPVTVTLRTRPRTGGRATTRPPLAVGAGATRVITLRPSRTVRRAGARRGLVVRAALRDPLGATRTVTVRGPRYRLAR